MSLPVVGVAITAALKVAFAWLWRTVLKKALQWLLVTVGLEMVLPWLTKLFTSKIGLFASAISCLIIYRIFWEEIISAVMYCGLKLTQYLSTVILKYDIDSDQVDAVYATISKLYIAASYWMPVDFAATLLTIYITVFTAVVGWRAALKFFTGLHLAEQKSGSAADTFLRNRKK